MIRRLVPVSAAAIALVAASAVPALAAPPVTETVHKHKVTETFVDVIPGCPDGTELYNITATTNAVEHSTIDPDGSEHFTFTETGKFSAVPQDGAGENFTGRYTVWGGGNFNAQAGVYASTFTFNLKGTGDEGTALNVHAVDHINEKPEVGVEHFFSKCQPETV